VKFLQLPTDSFLGSSLLTNIDLWFSFCSAAITRIVGAVGDIDVELGIEHILQCHAHEGGFSDQLGEESHDGSTYCALTALDLWKGLDRIQDRPNLVFWFCNIKDSVFQVVLINLKIFVIPFFLD
jgi:geranylgeranyl transferase type-1 subunit beta